MNVGVVSSMNAQALRSSSVHFARSSCVSNAENRYTTHTHTHTVSLSLHLSFWVYTTTYSV